MSKYGCRPWYPWYPLDFSNDLNVKLLSIYGEIVYRRILDAMWQDKKCRLPNDPDKIYMLSCKDFSREHFDIGYKELENVEMFKKDGGYITSTRLLRHYNECLERSEIARKKAIKRWS